MQQVKLISSDFKEVTVLDLVLVIIISRAAVSEVVKALSGLETVVFPCPSRHIMRSSEGLVSGAEGV